VFLTEHSCARVVGDAFAVPDAARKWADLYKLALARNIRCNPLRFFDTGPCSYWRAGHVTIDTGGTVYQCIGMPGRETCVVGDIRDGLTEAQKRRLCDVPLPALWDNERCRQCEWLPLCLGGCRFHAVVEHGSVDVPFCHRELFELCECEMLRFLALTGRLPDRVPLPDRA